MTMTQDRRQVLAAAGAAAFAGSGLAKAEGLRFGPPQAFSFDTLIARAKTAAARPYAPAPPADPQLNAIGFDAYGQIVFDARFTLWGGANAPAVRFFPQGQNFPRPVNINAVTQGVSRPVLYEPRLFQTPQGHPFRTLKNAGFAGFRVMNPDGQGDWLAFLGASYFRTAGALNQYGASARAIAINSGGPAPEEFPQFTEFWLESGPGTGLTVYAFLEGPSVAGAYRFDNRLGAEGVTQLVDAAVFFRRPVQTLGLAPITSMFWYGENSPPAVRDWRPEIHDSDGLALWTGAGERIWRPLDNPPYVITNAFSDDNPRGFGLIQRDRLFDHYQDDGAFYDKRPNVWIEPKTPFGPGSVRLLEIASGTETDDNIGAFWTPAKPVEAGDAFRVSYQINWTGTESEGALAKVIATRLGVGGRAGVLAKTGFRRFAVDFEGPALKGLTRESGVQAVVTSGATIEEVSAYPVVGTPFWRLIFDASVMNKNPTDIRAFLKRDQQTLSETWLYQLFPGR